MKHLAELRRRILWCLAVVAFGTGFGLTLWNPLLRLTTAPYCEALGVARGSDACNLYVTDPIGLFTSRMATALALGVLMALPVMTWHTLRFLVPGLRKPEKRWTLLLTVTASILAVLGAALSWGVWPNVLSFLVNFGGSEVQTLFDPARYLRFFALMVLSFAVCFQIPVILLVLQLTKVVQATTLAKYRREAIVGNIALAAVLTPSQDPVSLLVLAIPMCVLYEVSMVFGRLAQRRGKS